MKRTRKKGQAIVEMAVLFPLFLLVVVGGIIDFGFAFYNAIALQQIANDTAQWAAEGNGTTGIADSAQITAYAMSRRPAWWNRPFTVHPPRQITTPTGGRLLQIRISYESPTFTPFYQTMLGALTGSTHIMLATSAAYQIPRVVATR